MSCIIENTPDYLRMQMQMAEQAISKIYSEFYGSRILNGNDRLGDIYKSDGLAAAIAKHQTAYNSALEALNALEASE
jgi:hypothetical protein